MLKFIDDGHRYVSTTGENINWTSVTTAIHHFTPGFDGPTQAAKSSKNKKSKWFGMTAIEILDQWQYANDYSITLGSWYHKMMEDAVLSHDSIVVDDKELGIVRPIMVNGEKFAPEQKLENNKKYPEHLTYLKSVGLCGQADDIEVVDGFVNVNDYKTNKEIKLQSYKSWDGMHQMMKRPFHHLQDCNLIHYNFQLSIYMYMILKHNPQLKPGKITIKHIMFEETGRDRFDFPIYKQAEDGSFFIKDTQDYVVPFMLKECTTLHELMKTNKIPAKISVKAAA